MVCTMWSAREAAADMNSQERILEYSGKAGELDLYPVVIEDSARPTYSVLDNMMLRLTGIEEPKDWKAALKEYLDETGGLE